MESGSKRDFFFFFCPCLNVNNNNCELISKISKYTEDTKLGGSAYSKENCEKNITLCLNGAINGSCNLMPVSNGYWP